MYNKVELCGVNTGQLPVLTEAEKRQLLTLAHAGDKAARARMVEGNLRLVLSVVQRFAKRGENLDDLFQVGCIGLIKAIDNFDPAQPVRFSTYGVPMIIGEIRRFLRDNNALRVSRTLRDTAYRAMQARETLEKQLGREPTMDEIAAAAGLARREVTAALESVVEPLSLDEPVYTDGGDAMYVIDQVRDPDSEESWISGLQFRDTVAALSPREKRIMELRYLRGKTQMEVAQEIGISQAQVSRLGKKVPCNQFLGRALNTAAPLLRPSGGVHGALRFYLRYFGGGSPAAQMPLGFVACQHRPHLCRQPRADPDQPHRNVLVHGGLAAPKRCSRSAHGGPPAPRCILPAVPPAVPDLLSYPTTPCIVLLQPMRRAGQLCRQGLTFAARLRYTGRGHKNRGAVRLRSALSGVPFT